MRPTQAPFPATRLRRPRASAARRAMVRENTLTVDDFIWPIFVREGTGIEEPVPSMPGVLRRSVDHAVEAAREAVDLGIKAMCIFPYTGIEDRTEDCAGAWDPGNPSNRAIRAIKDACGDDIGVLTDVALDPYTAHGQDGLLDEKGYVVNDATVAVLVDQAINQAEAGADIIAPRSEEHTSELQSLTNLVCRLLLGKKKKKNTRHSIQIEN